MLALLDELESQRCGVDHAVLSRGTGEQVVNWYGPVVRRAVAGAQFDALFESVSTDAGEIVMPRFDRFILPTLRTSGRWEPDEANFVRAHLARGGRALNVGANVGYLTLVMAQSAGPSGLVIALEPEPLNFDLLWTNIRRNHAYNVLPIHTAAGESTGTSWLNLSPDNSGDHRTAPHPMGVGRLEVPMVAVDDLLGEVDVDLVVSDAQGYDHRVLRGMALLIKRCRPAMLVEFWPPGILELGENPADVIDEYRELGYRMRIVEDDRDVTRLAAHSVVEIVPEYGRDHLTLALT